MLQSVNNLAQQSVVSPLQQRGEQQQQQVNQRQQQSQSSVTNPTPEGAQTRPTGTQSAQSQQSNTGGRQQNFTELSVSDFRAEFGNQPPERGSLVDVQV